MLRPERDAAASANGCLSDVDLDESFQVREARTIPGDYYEVMGQSSSSDHAIEHMRAGAAAALHRMAQQIVMGTHAAIIERNTTPER